ncbi:DUF2288 family protein [Verrucomicrobiaceae bacterium 227]
MKDPKKLRYQMLGEDHSTAEEKLTKYCGEVGWDYLIGPYKNETLYFVDPALKLEAVGVAITADDKSSVDAWLKAGDMVKIEALHAQQWEGTEQQFEALVVSPFVLCRPVS